ncbi:hypothetical protein Acr_18g0005340 [Actinidia rufa]|uniref:Uncharacterized protein n=1 Tax=Actinidia rufa TaxID=165716 RepID=A0A7J0G6D8_9ERIC|nr:hypothetical protein Acr_18g0005340 [Actinidia rufa]
MHTNRGVPFLAFCAVPLSLVCGLICAIIPCMTMDPLMLGSVLLQAESAIAALNCSGAVLGSLPIRVSPSKTPVRPRAPRPSTH